MKSYAFGVGTGMPAWSTKAPFRGHEYRGYRDWGRPCTGTISRDSPEQKYSDSVEPQFLLWDLPRALVEAQSAESLELS